MICEPCSELEHRRAPRNGDDVEMEERGQVEFEINAFTIKRITLYQCPKCKSVTLESETI